MASCNLARYLDDCNSVHDNLLPSKFFQYFLATSASSVCRVSVNKCLDTSIPQWIRHYACVSYTSSNLSSRDLISGLIIGNLDNTICLSTLQFFPSSGEIIRTENVFKSRRETWFSRNFALFSRGQVPTNANDCTEWRVGAPSGWRGNSAMEGREIWVHYVGDKMDIALQVLIKIAWA